MTVDEKAAERYPYYSDNIPERVRTLSLRQAYITGYQQASSEGERLKGLIDEAYRTGYVNRGIYYNYPDKIAKEEYQKSLNAFKVKHNI